ncbi:ArsR family transcriptional regulator [Clostridium estertheticum]|uniref:ArsR family transcriptional regulator n=1 Tax=Clostridium estertheticum TaxID=238834 RepID=A0AA47EK56_9CLOT|nr:ArsR family transcriptional regulator [Clostridium estertheticum]MBU3155447.1 ArsR family transcriptional regulator [Clostridium estertheticum]MBU3199531.1 ArsR family transcriptional regulator [Clostridium estertheticum]WAG60516.1 ArsR family transcriptional regulator [Clostridium estertheticum]WAG65393.1 ArsR family transcriptional regulator [Clostridium estertheticum]
MIHIKNLEESLPIFKALSSDVRIQILNLLSEYKQLNMNDIAKKLKLSNGAITMHIRKLEECGIIKINILTAKHGIQKICYLHEDKFIIDIGKQDMDNSYELEIGIGQYSFYEIQPTCGIATKDKLIGEVDNPSYFADPDRINADILWFSKGAIEYRIPNYLKPSQVFSEIQISMEISSEAPGNCSLWPSDIYFNLNDIYLGSWTSPGDYADTKGILTPNWWFSNWNQYGLLKLLSINKFGTFIDGLKISDTNLNDINLNYKSDLSLKLSIPEDAKHKGGLTLFGKNFGNYNQGISIRVVYEQNLIDETLTK